MVTEELMNNALDFVDKVKQESRQEILNAVNMAITYHEENPFKSIADE